MGALTMYVLRHKVTGYYCSRAPSSGGFAYSPNLEDAIMFPSFDASESERLAHFGSSAAGVWMTIELSPDPHAID